VIKIGRKEENWRFVVYIFPDTCWISADNSVDSSVGRTMSKCVKFHYDFLHPLLLHEENIVMCSKRVYVNCICAWNMKIDERYGGSDGSGRRDTYTWLSLTFLIPWLTSSVSSFQTLMPSFLFRSCETLILLARTCLSVCISSSTWNRTRQSNFVLGISWNHGTYFR